ncbi:AzlD domain-containing protein [Halobellus sp. GM3]|uniref:AzlD domain-containing protein n=1 Tax=Halobellus sp. GM3 TaxID=3458410 RepID=UPI00403E2561
MTAIESETVWLMVVCLSLATFALRSSFLLSINKLGGLPAWLKRVLPFIPAVVLAALIAPNLVPADGSGLAALGNPRLFAGLVAFVVAWYTESMILTVSVGMIVLWGLLWV